MLEPLFILRNNNKVSKYITKVLNERRSDIASKYGFGEDNTRMFINQFKNAIVNYAYQNYMTNSIDNKGDIVNIPEMYNDLEVVVGTAPNGARIEGDKMIVDLKVLESDYTNKKYEVTNLDKDNYTSRGLRPFAPADDLFQSKSSFFKYVMEREYLRSTNSIESLKLNNDYTDFLTILKKNITDDTLAAKKAYEVYLNQKALFNTFNRRALMVVEDYSFTNYFFNVLNEFPVLKEKYPVLTQFTEPKIFSGEKVITLNNKGIVKGEIAENYYQNILDLANPQVVKVKSLNKEKDVVDNKRISELFQMLPLVSLYTNGMGYSKYGINKILPYDSFMDKIFEAGKIFTANKLNENTFDDIFYKLIKTNKSIFVDYVSPLTSTVETPQVPTVPLVSVTQTESGGLQFGQPPVMPGEVVEEQITIQPSTSVVIEPTGLSEKTKTFKNSLYRGQEDEPIINQNGDLVILATYDTLFKSKGSSFAKSYDMAQGYGARYSKNPYVIEINKDYADKISPLIEGGTQAYGNRVVGDQGEERFISENDIIIPKGMFMVHRTDRIFNTNTYSAKQLIDGYNKQFVEDDIAEYNRYGEASQGYAKEGSDYYEAIENELLKRGISKNDFVFLQQPNPIYSLKEIVAGVFNIQPKPGELEPTVNQNLIDQYLSKQKEFLNKLEKFTTQPATNLPGSENKINIYAGTGENAELSNFAERPFMLSFDDLMENKIETTRGDTFFSVEQAFQVMKYHYLNWNTNAPNNSKEQQNAIDDIINEIEKTTEGPTIKRLGRKVNLSKEQIEAWDKVSLKYMKDFITESFKQNPESLAKLLATGNATLTHTQDKGKWGTEFPKLLMEVRNELRTTQPSTQSVGSQDSEIVLSNFYNTLTSAQKEKIGTLEDLYEEYNQIPYEQSVEDFIDEIKTCKL